MVVSNYIKEKTRMCLYITIHSIVLVHHALTGIYALMHFHFENSTDPELIFLYKYKDRYLTMWNMWIQSFYSGISIAYELHSSFAGDNKYLADFMSRTKSYVLISILFPSATFISFTFWTLYNIDTDLLFPKQLALLLPWWYNHCIHTNILVLPIVEFFFTASLPNYKLAFVGISLYYWIYDATVIYTYYESSKWIYKVFEVLDWRVRAFYMLCNYILTIGAMHLGIVVQKRILNYKNAIVTEVPAKVKSK